MKRQAKDDKSPATKSDLVLELGKFTKDNEKWRQRFNADNERWRLEFKEDNEKWRKEVNADNERWREKFSIEIDEKFVRSEDRIIRILSRVIEYKESAYAERIMRHFDVVAENMLIDFKKAFKDRTEQHGDAILDLNKRVTVIEQHIGLAV